MTVAIPTLDAGPAFAEMLSALANQDVPAPVELLVCDSGSSDGTVSLARHHGARVLQIARSEFSHGATRNLLMEQAQGAHVAFLTQDAMPADSRWLGRLLEGFSRTQNVGLVFGPYRPRPDAGVSVRRELIHWFDSLSDGPPRIDILPPKRRDRPAGSFLGALGYFTDANGCVARAAWERVPFRQVAYAEDHLLAIDMLRAGYAKVYEPRAAVVHSHDYSPGEWLRRSFDEARAVREVYGEAPAARWGDAVNNLRGNIAADVRFARDVDGTTIARVLRQSLVHHGARTAGMLLGARADRLPPRLVTELSLERRT